LSRRIKNRRRALRLFTWNKTSQVNEKKNIVKERNKSKQWYSEWYVKSVKPATPGKSKECVTKHKKRYNFFIEAQFSPSTRQGPPEPTGLFIKYNYQTTFLYKNNPGYKDRSRCMSMSNKSD